MAWGARFEDALIYANRLHRDQVRKATQVPYVTHLLAVAALVGENGGDEDQVIAALLHDAVEDQGGEATRLEILRRFGEAVVEIVDACSDTDQNPKPPWRERKVRHLAHMAEVSPRVRLVVAADKLHNARSLASVLRQQGGAVWDRFRGGREGTLWYYRRMVETLGRDWQHPLLEELERTVARLFELAETR